MASETSSDVDYYLVVGVSSTADSNEIRTAYRKASLKVHPDRNPNDSKAAEKFHALNTAFEILLDPIKRSEFDSKRAAKIARAARFEGLDNKRKALARDLEAREEAYRKTQQEQDKKSAKARKLDEIKAAGARMRKAKEEEANARHQLAQANADRVFKKPEDSYQTKYPPLDSTEIEPELDPLDCTLRFKWTRKKLPEVLDSDSLSEKIVSSGLIVQSEIESVIVSSKGTSSSGDNRDSKKFSAVVCFKSVGLCQRFLEFSQTDPCWTNCSVNLVKKTSERLNLD
ncbi:hypothetical protein BY996DRAFT_8386446 [Phakopsora pachyrhizi]|uniref:J domain-containing protein n=1 Tax=Phakopsora pachyrhizi TaxID=170000 RepID=A0AAV0B4A1_PHAPC|nr:hypothetical protein BY996DRAFT_8386446 [Phakopsora pachyrhizi]CAH7677020.1 hypothetical protein PPACK8108_LOCUS12139 [Phakopsora pachyrhizi]